MWAVLEAQGNPAFPVKLAIPEPVGEVAEVGVFLLLTQDSNPAFPHVRVTYVFLIFMEPGREGLVFKAALRGRLVTYPHYLPHILGKVLVLLGIQVAVDQVAQTGQQEAVVR